MSVFYVQIIVVIEVMFQTDFFFSFFLLRHFTNYSYFLMNWSEVEDITGRNKQKLLFINIIKSHWQYGFPCAPLSLYPSLSSIVPLPAGQYIFNNWKNKIKNWLVLREREGGSVSSDIKMWIMVCQSLWGYLCLEFREMHILYIHIEHFCVF